MLSWPSCSVRVAPPLHRAACRCKRDGLGRKTAYDARTSLCYPPCPAGLSRFPGTDLCVAPCPPAYPAAAGATQCRSKSGAWAGRRHRALAGVPPVAANIMEVPFGAEAINRASLPRYWDPPACPQGERSAEAARVKEQRGGAA